MTRDSYADVASAYEAVEQLTTFSAPQLRAHRDELIARTAPQATFPTGGLLVLELYPHARWRRLLAADGAGELRPCQELPVVHGDWWGGQRSPDDELLIVCARRG